MEIDGGLSVITKSEKQVPSVLLVDEGRIDFDTLSSLDKNEAWLRSELEKLGYWDVENIVYCEWKPGEELHVFTYDDTTTSEQKLDG